MEELGLPLAFGKQQPAQQPKPESSIPQRDGASAPSQRGNNRGGRKPRGGRGGGQHHPHIGDAPAHVLNEGVKRPFTDPSPLGSPTDVPESSPLHPSLPLAPHFDYPHREAHQHRGRGGGRGGSSGGGGGPRSLHEVPEQGFFKESFCEDPWAELLQARKRRRASH